jgi:hypothetical protein
MEFVLLKPDPTILSERKKPGHDPFCRGYENWLYLNTQKTLDDH